MLLQINGIVDGVRLSWGSLSPAVLNNAEKLLGVIASGSFGGWVYGIVSLLEGGRQLNLEEGKKECGSKQLGQRLAKTKTDPDLKVFEGLDRFRKLIQRYERIRRANTCLSFSWSHLHSSRLLYDATNRALMQGQ